MHDASCRKPRAIAPSASSDSIATPPQVDTSIETDPGVLNRAWTTGLAVSGPVGWRCIDHQRLIVSLNDEEMEKQRRDRRPFRVSSCSPMHARGHTHKATKPQSQSKPNPLPVFLFLFRLPFQTRSSTTRARASSCCFLWAPSHYSNTHSKHTQTPATRLRTRRGSRRAQPLHWCHESNEVYRRQRLTDGHDHSITRLNFLQYIIIIITRL